MGPSVPPRETLWPSPSLDFLAPDSVQPSLGQVVGSSDSNVPVLLFSFQHLFIEKYQVLQSVSMGKPALSYPTDGKSH